MYIHFLMVDRALREMDIHYFMRKLHLMVTFSKMSEFLSRKSTGIMARILENQSEIQRSLFHIFISFFLTFISFDVILTVHRR